MGLLGLPVALVALLIGTQALLAGQLGMRIGARPGDELRERAVQVAGALLMLLGVGLAVLRVTGHSV